MEQRNWTWTEIMDYLDSLTHNELKSIKPSQFDAISYGQREILKLNIHNRISSNIGVGDRVKHDKYGIGFVSSHSKLGSDAVFVSFDGRTDILWIEKHELIKVG